MTDYKALYFSLAGKVADAIELPHSGAARGRGTIYQRERAQKGNKPQE